MASNWIETTLGGIADPCGGVVDGPFGSNLPASGYVTEGIPVIRGSNLSLGKEKFKQHEFVYISQDAFEKLQRSECLPNDIIFTKKGTLGQTGIIPNPSIFTRYILSSNQMRLRVDPLKALPAYIYYVVSSPQTIEKIIRDSDCTGVPKINLEYLRKFPVKLPDLKTQKAIAHILGSLDDKIELNRQMNETLEAMAQALFKSWFVDFDPVIDNVLAAGNAIPDEFAERAKQRKAIEKKDNADIQSLFPDEFEFTEEMGWIPKGWASGTIAGISFVKGGYAFKSKDFTDTGFPVIKIKNINSDRTVNTSDVQFIPNEIAKKAESFWLKTGDLMMAMTGATVGKFGLLVAENKKAYLLNQRVAKFSPISSVSDKIWFIYCFLNQKSTIDYIVNIAEGSAQPNISADSIMATQLVKPSNELINIFNETVDSNLNKMLMNREECLTLEKLRDTLLPKLMSGELRIPDAAALVDEVL